MSINFGSCPTQKDSEQILRDLDQEVVGFGTQKTRQACDGHILVNLKRSWFLQLIPSRVDIGFLSKRRVKISDVL